MVGTGQEVALAGGIILPHGDVGPRELRVDRGVVDLQAARAEPAAKAGRAAPPGVAAMAGWAPRGRSSCMRQ